MATHLTDQTPTQLVDRATTDLLNQIDWNVNLFICDYIKSCPEITKEIFQCIERNIHSKSPKTVLYSLILLESCVKNCYHISLYVNNRDFLASLIQVYNSSRSPEIKPKITELLLTWSLSFQGCLAFSQAVATLERQGASFPMDVTPFEVPLPYSPTRTRSTSASKASTSTTGTGTSSSRATPVTRLTEKDLLSASGVSTAEKEAEKLKKVLSQSASSERLSEEVLQDLYLEGLRQRELMTSAIQNLVSSEQNNEGLLNRIFLLHETLNVFCRNCEELRDSRTSLKEDLISIDQQTQIPPSNSQATNQLLDFLSEPFSSTNNSQYKNYGFHNQHSTNEKTLNQKNNNNNNVAEQIGISGMNNRFTAVQVPEGMNRLDVFQVERPQEMRKTGVVLEKETNDDEIPRLAPPPAARSSTRRTDSTTQQHPKTNSRQMDFLLL